MQSKYQDIINLIRKGDVVLFIGAGFSIKAGAPSCNDLCDTLYKALPETIREEKGIKSEYTLQNLSEIYENYYGRESLINLLRKAFTFEAKDTTDQRQLANIPQFKHIITTNYDSLIEDAYSSNCNVIATSSDLSKIDSRKPVIYKIHGDFSRIQNIVITKEDYSRIYEKKQENLIWDSVRTEFSRHNILFIGYSLSDQNIQILIKHIREQMGDSAKPLYVLTPSIEETAQLRLKKYGAIYIQGTAEDLFNELIPALKDHIVEDFEQQTTSPEVCAQFLSEYDLCPQVELGGPNMPNKLITVKSTSGNIVHHTINFTLKGNGVEDPFEQIKPHYDERFGNLPVKEITNFQGFEYRANGILMKRGDNLKSIFFVPVPKLGEIFFSVPQKNILLKRTCRYYNNWNNQVQIDVDVNIGDLQILVPISPNKEEGFRFKQKDNYTDNNTAIEWENLFVALFSGCEFSVTIRSEEGESRLFTYALKKNELKQERKEAKRILRYYKCIQEIELLRGKCFSIYHNFSDDNYEAAELIYYYLKKTPMIVQHPSKGFEYEVKTTSDTIKTNKKAELLFIQSYQNITCKLNEMEVTIPHIQVIYKHSIFKGRKKDPNGDIVLTFVDKAKDHTIQMSDEPMRIQTDEGVIEI